MAEYIITVHCLPGGVLVLPVGNLATDTIQNCNNPVSLIASAWKDIASQIFEFELQASIDMALQIHYSLQVYNTSTHLMT